MLTRVQMSAKFQSRSKDPLLIAPSLNQFRFQKKISRFSDSGGSEASGRLGREGRGTRATINLDLVCILLFRTYMYTHIILTLSILQTYSLTWLSSNTVSFYIQVISPLGVLKTSYIILFRKNIFTNKREKKKKNC